MSVRRPIKESLALSLAGLDWICYRADSLGRFVAHRAKIIGSKQHIVLVLLLVLVLVLSEAVLVLVLDGCLNLSELPLFDRIGRRVAIVPRPIKELLKLSHAGLDWVCYRADSL
jgi:hypothetical protein